MFMSRSSGGSASNTAGTSASTASCSLWHAARVSASCRRGASSVATWARKKGHAASIRYSPGTNGCSPTVVPRVTSTARSLGGSEVMSTRAGSGHGRELRNLQILGGPPGGTLGGAAHEHGAQRGPSPLEPAGTGGEMALERGDVGHSPEASDLRVDLRDLPGSVPLVELRQHARTVADRARRARKWGMP